MSAPHSTRIDQHGSQAGQIPAAPAAPRPATLVLSEEEKKRYSLARALEGAHRGVWARAAFERELSQHIAELQGSAQRNDPHALFVPAAVLGHGQRDLTVGAYGASMVSSNVLGVVDALRPRSVALRLGARTIPGLRGNETYVSADGGVTIAWLTNEGASAGESSLVLNGLALSPKTASAYVESSRQIGLQAPVLSEQLLRMDLLSGLATALDAAVLAGTGAAGQPRGIVNTPGIHTFSGAALSHAGVLGAQSAILTANGLGGEGALSYVCRPAVAELLAKRQGFSADTPMWTGALADGVLAGCRAMSTMNMPAGALACCDFSRVVVPEWGVGAVEIRVNPYANFAAGSIGYAAFLSIDVALLAPGAGAAFSNVN